MVGVSCAWHLQARGHRVTLVDRQPPGRETSFGNAGIIQREAVRPYRFPRDLPTLLRVLPNHEIDIRYQPAGMMHAAGPLFQYWRNSEAHRYARIVPEYAALITRALDAHAELIDAAGAGDLIRRDGYLKVFRTADALEADHRQADQDAERYDLRYEILDRAALAGQAIGQIRLPPGEGGSRIWPMAWPAPFTGPSPGPPPTPAPWWPPMPIPSGKRAGALLRRRWRRCHEKARAGTR